MSSAIGSFSGAMTSYQQGKAQKETLYRQGDYYVRQGQLTMKKAEEERTQRSKELNMLYGSQRARYSASGVTHEEGSPQEVIKKSMEEGNAELERIRYWGKEAQKSYNIMAYESYKAGRLAKKAGDMGAIAGVMQGIVSAATFASNSYESYKAGQLAKKAGAMQGVAGAGTSAMSWGSILGQ